MAELSQEMKVQILLRLPPKSLMRFKCVEKWWHGLINSPNFVAKQVSFANSNKHNKLSSSSDSIDILLARYVFDLNTGNKELVFSSLDLPHSVTYDEDSDDDDGHHLSVSDDDDLHVPSLPFSFDKYWGDCGLNIAGHCDGIICLTDYKEQIVLCNPSIKQFNHLPVTSNLLLACATGIFKPSAAVGFGYADDLNSKTYKVVRIFDFGVLNPDDDNYEHCVQQPPKAEVYSLVTNLWKEIKVDNLDKETRVVMPDSTDSIYFKGTLYWSGHEGEKEYDCPFTPEIEDGNVYTQADCKERVITFDLANEVFHVISYPEVDEDGDYYCNYVFGLWKEDSIALCAGKRGSIYYTPMNIWVLNVECSSWTNYLTLDPVPHNINLTLALSTLEENG